MGPLLFSAIRTRVLTDKATDIATLLAPTVLAGDLAPLRGRIDLQVPIEGTIDSPEFAYKKVLWQAVRKILANVAAAPFRAIGRMFGADQEDLELVGFVAGRSDLPAPEQEKLAKVAAEVAARPEKSA